MKRIILIACLTLLYSNAAFGGVQYGGKSFLAKFDFEKDAVSLLISDQAKDGCMPSPQKVKDAYEGELRRMGIKIQKPDSVARYFFSIIVLGMAVGNDVSCVYVLEVKLEPHVEARRSGTEDQFQYLTPQIWNHMVYGIRAKASMQQHLEDSARGVVNDLFLALSRAKD